MLVFSVCFSPTDLDSASVDSHHPPGSQQSSATALQRTSLAKSACCTLQRTDKRNWRPEGPSPSALSLLSNQEKALTAAHAVLNLLTAAVTVMEARGRKGSAGHQRWKRQVIWADPWDQGHWCFKKRIRSSVLCRGSKLLQSPPSPTCDSQRSNVPELNLGFRKCPH